MESLRQNWFVIQQLIKRDKQRSLSSTFMGELWEIINPLINMIVMVLVFGKMFGYGIAGGFPLYVLTGTTLYGLFTSGTTMCLQALMGNKNFLIKTQLNRNVYVIQKILLAFRNFLFSLMIYAFVIALYRISPSVTWLLFIPDVFLMLIMMLAGLGMVVGNLFSGKISGRYSPLRIAAMTDGVIAVTLLLIFAFGEHKVASLALAFLCCAGLFALSAPLQILLLQNAKGGEMLGAAGGQMAFNLGSAIGAYFGGMMITLGFSWRYVTLPAAILSFSAMSALLIYGYLRARRAQANARALA